MKNKTLILRGFPPAGAGWHDSGESSAMTLLLVSFFLLGGLLSLLVVADDRAADATEAARVRAFDKY